MVLEQPVLVTGGTGNLGSTVVRLLHDAGQRVRVLSRGRRDEAAPAAVEWATGDLDTGQGLREALQGVGTVVHCATNPRTRGGDVQTTHRLVEAARTVDVTHLLYISIVGVDRVPFSYYRGKRAAELRIEESGMPYTILRATQFHDLVFAVLSRMARAPVLPLPTGALVQPVEVQEVAARLAALTTDTPAGRVADMGGPEVRTAVDLARGYLRLSGQRRGVLPFGTPGAMARALRAGGLLTPDHRDGVVGFEEFVARQVVDSSR